MTSDSFKPMNESEQRDMARRLWEGSNVLDFETALEIVKRRPNDARKILRMRAETERRQAERARGQERLRQALIEDYG